MLSNVLSKTRTISEGGAEGGDAEILIAALILEYKVGTGDEGYTLKPVKRVSARVSPFSD